MLTTTFASPAQTSHCLLCTSPGCQLGLSNLTCPQQISHSNLFLLQSSPFHLVAPSPIWLLEPNTPNSSSILGIVLSISICIQTTNKSCPPVVCVSNLTARHSCFHHPSQSKPPALYPELRTLPPKQAPISTPLPSIPYIESTF